MHGPPFRRVLAGPDNGSRFAFVRSSPLLSASARALPPTFVDGAYRRPPTCPSQANCPGCQFTCTLAPRCPLSGLCELSILRDTGSRHCDASSRGFVGGMWCCDSGHDSPLQLHAAWNSAGQVVSLGVWKSRGVKLISRYKPIEQSHPRI